MPCPDSTHSPRSSAGVGRSGAFIALSSLLLRDRDRDQSRGLVKPDHAIPSPLGPLPLSDADPDADVARTVDALREYRGMMVQTEEQLGLVYEVVRAERAERGRERDGAGK